MKNGQKFIEIAYEKDEPALRQNGSRIAIDQGYKKLLSCSDGQIYGQHLELIYQRLSRKVQGSKLFCKLLKFRSDEINRVINEFFEDHGDLRELYIEDLKNVKRNSKLNHKVMNKVQR